MLPTTFFHDTDGSTYQHPSNSIPITILPLNFLQQYSHTTTTARCMLHKSSHTHHQESAVVWCCVRAFEKSAGAAEMTHKNRCFWWCSPIHATTREGWAGGGWCGMRLQIKIQNIWSTEVVLVRVFFLDFVMLFFILFFLLLLLYVSIAAAYIVWIFFAGFLFDFSVLLCCVFCRQVLS